MSDYATRPSVLRLERNSQHLAAQDVLHATRDAYASLAEAVVEAGRHAGYLGSDPLAALGQLIAPAPDWQRQNSQVLELWHLFLTAFREDEMAYEARSFQDKAADLNRQIGALAPGEDPEPQLIQSVLDQLTAFWQQRHAELSDRLDQLIGELGQVRGRAESADLQVAYQQDELEGVRKVVMAALLELGRSVSTQTSFARDVELLVAAYRRALKQEREALQAQQLHYEQFGKCLKTVLAAQPLPVEDLPTGPDKRLLQQVSELVTERQELEKAYAQLHEQQAQTVVQRDQLQADVAQRDKLLVRYEFGAQTDHNEDERLAVYRQIVAAYERDEQPTDLIAQVRKLEMVLVLQPHAEGQRRQHLERQLGVLAQCLGDLRHILPLTEDPKRYRPRLLGSSPYKLKTLIGSIQALRDASRDVLVFLDRARWVAGLRMLGRDLRRLRKVFEEMVRLTADLREKVGAAPPVSMSLQLNTLSGCAGLPGVLADDIDVLLRKRGVGPKALGGLAELMDEVVGMLTTSLDQACGQETPEDAPQKRASTKKQLERLCGALRMQAARLETVFAEAAGNEWQPSAVEERLLEADASLVLAAQQVDHACQDLALLAGAPPTDFPRLPTGSRLNLEKLLMAAKARVAWLEDLAQYRVDIQTG